MRDRKEAVLVALMVVVLLVQAALTAWSFVR